MIVKHQMENLSGVQSALIHALKTLKKNGWLYGEVADKANIRRERLSEIVNGKRRPIGANLEKLLKVKEVRKIVASKINKAA